MTNHSITRAGGTPSVSAAAAANDPFGLRSICGACAGAVFETVSELAITGTGPSIRIPQHRVPTGAELDLLIRFASLVPMGSNFATTLTEEELVTALNELRPSWSEQPAHVVDVSVMPMHAPGGGAIAAVDSAVLASFLNDVSDRTVEAAIEDVQMLLGRARGGSPRDVETIQGLVADLDYAINDPAKEHLARGAVAPNVAFATENGRARLLYVFKSAFAPSTTALVEKRSELFHALNVAFPTLDPTCLSPAQRQYLPKFIRTTKGPRRIVDRKALAITAEPLDLQRLTLSLPSTALGILGLGGGGLGDAERDEVIAYLSALGIEVPATGSARTSRCPIKQHGARKVYASRSSRGAISCRCLGGHGGMGQRTWSEHDLLRVARGGTP